MTRGVSALVLSLSFFLAGCSTGRDDAASLAARHGMRAAVVNGGHFDLYALTPATYLPGHPLTVFIEGDGFAYITRQRLSDDPTPRRAIALQMAVRDPSPNVIYLGRPCQYVTGSARRNCHPAYWSIARYSEDVVAATNAVIERLLAGSGANGLRLVGHSGGGVVALLVAARRTDVRQVVTVAAPLDTDAWTRMDDAAPLVLSLNPADAADRLAQVPQVHLAGGRDTVVPPPVAHSYAARFPSGHRPEVRVVPDEAHECCWVEHWPALAATLP